MWRGPDDEKPCQSSPSIRRPDQAFLDRNLLYFDWQVARINHQSVHLDPPGQRTGRQTARQGPIMIELSNGKDISHQLCLVAAGAGRDSKMTAQIGHRHIRRARPVMQKIDLANDIKNGAGPGLGLSHGQWAWPLAAQPRDRIPRQIGIFNGQVIGAKPVGHPRQYRERFFPALGHFQGFRHRRWNLPLDGLRLQAAFLIFFAAAARTWVIATNLLAFGQRGDVVPVTIGLEPRQPNLG
jgi:hypothetical protein